MVYLSTVVSSMLTTLFFIFAILMIGYFIGSFEYKGIGLGDAGVLLIALIFGIIANNVGSFEIGGKTVVLFNDSVKSMYSFVSNIGTAMFVTAVGLIAGPKFFRYFNKDSVSYLVMGFVIIALGVITTVAVKYISGIEMGLAVGLMTGALTSTPGLSGAMEVAANPDAVTAGYGIAYLFGVLGVVFFVQLMPKILHTDIAAEREKYKALAGVKGIEFKRKVHKIDDLDFFPFFLTVVAGMMLGRIYIPGINFSLGTAGGSLVMGLIVGHFGHIGSIDLRVSKSTLNFFRELGLVLFLVGAGVPGGVNFIKYVSPMLFVYGAIMTTVPMIAGFLLGKFVFKLDIFNNLGSITGGMTSTPALGTLIHTAGTDEVSGAYAATYPIALVFVTLAAKALVMFL